MYLLQGTPDMLVLRMLIFGPLYGYWPMMWRGVPAKSEFAWRLERRVRPRLAWRCAKRRLAHVSMSRRLSSG